MFDVIDHLTQSLSGQLGSPWLWLIVLLVAGLDALLPFMPSEGTVLTVAVLLGPDLGGLTLLAVLAAAGAFAGDCLGYGIGRHAGPRLLRRLHRDERGRRRFAWARETVARNAAALIVAGRYLPGGRVASGLVTGSTGYPLRRFVLYDACGAIGWAVYCAVLGHLAGARFADEPGKGILLALGIGVLVVAVIDLARRAITRNRRSCRL
jgi:membrane-associated protein